MGLGPAVSRAFVWMKKAVLLYLVYGGDSSSSDIERYGSLSAGNSTAVLLQELERTALLDISLKLCLCLHMQVT